MACIAQNVCVSEWAKKALKSWLFISSLSSMFIKLNIIHTDIKQKSCVCVIVIAIARCCRRRCYFVVCEVMNRIKTHRRQQHDIIIKSYFEMFRFT